ncbi:tetratricopeptide repeat protein [Chloroflexota bacterium]
MKKSVVLYITSLILLLWMLPAIGCQVTSIQSEKHLKNGLALVLDGEYEEGIVELNKAIDLDPEYADAYYNRGIAYDKSGEVGKAISDYEKCIELSNDYELVEAAQIRLDAITQ